MKCSCCGKELGAFTTDIGYQLPDVVWAIPREQRSEQAKFNSDLCCLGERYFLRGIAYVPIIASGHHFGWGFWVEVDQEAFKKYLAVYEIDGSGEEPIFGTLANTPPGYENTESQEVKIFFGPPDDRPTLVLEPSPHQLWQEQANGITLERVHEINKFCSR